MKLATISKRWTKKEDEFLIQNYETLTCLQIAIKLNRTCKAVTMRSSNLRKIGNDIPVKRVVEYNYSPKTNDNSDVLFYNSFQRLYNYRGEKQKEKVLNELRNTNCSFSLFIAAAYVGATMNEIEKFWNNIPKPQIIKALEKQTKDYINDKITETKVKSVLFEINAKLHINFN